MIDPCQVPLVIVRPPSVDELPPKAIAVEPMVIELFASWLLGIALVPNAPVVLL